MKYVIKSQDDVAEMDFNSWYDFYLQNIGSFWLILRQRIALRKYSLAQGSELDDLMQDALERVILQFNRKKTISKRWKYTIFKMACMNSINTHIRSYDKFAARPSQYMIRKFNLVRENPVGNSFGWVGDGERVPTTSGDYSRIDLEIDLSLILDQRQLKITKFMHMGFQQKEIAIKFGVAPNQIWREVQRIRRIIDMAGLRTA